MRKRMEVGGRNRFVDALKGACIIAVVATHVEWGRAQRLRLLFPFWVDMAVPLFMLVSGYVYTKSFQKNGIEGLDGAYNRIYLVKNFVRYTFPYAVAYALELAFNALVAFRHGGSSIKNFVVDWCFIFLQGGIGPGSYYYPEMVQVMVFFPAIYVLVRKYGGKAVAVVAFATFFLEVMKIAYFQVEGQYRLLLFRYFLLLAFGSYFALNRMKRRLWLLSAVGAAFIVLFSYTQYRPRIFIWWTTTSLLPALFVVPVFGALVESKLHFAPLELVGRASYNVFLVQMVYFSTLYGVVQNHVGEDCVVRTVVSIAICVAVGIVFYELEFRITKRISFCMTRKLLGLSLSHRAHTS